MGTWMSGAAAIYWTFLISYTYGGCEFPKQWSGRWFQSGVPQPLAINSTYIETKGECYEEQGDKYLVYDRMDNCYRCMAIHVKHSSVLQFKETFCERKASLHDICYGISGDAPLYSMFRKSPEAKPIPCPFKSAPFTFSYNRGAGDCKDPLSKAESCTDDSRLVLKYQACLDDPSTETHVEELVCLATWKEGSTRYLIGKISQGNRRAPTSDEDQYRCFIYLKSTDKGKVVYHIAQSGEATCTGVQSAHEGSRTMKFTAVDNHHNRCKFPTWITDHHTWLSLDHKKTYKFSQRNATLKILDEEPKLGSRNNQQTQQPQQHFAFQEFGFVSQDQHRQNSEMRVICHAILESKEQKKVQIVAHITAGCDSGYVCMVFYKRDSHVIEIQQSEDYHDNPDDACNSFDPTTTPYTTLITTTLHPKKCPNVGRFTLLENLPITGERRKRRQQQETGLESMPNAPIAPECLTPKYEALSVGCNSNELMEFKTACLQQPTNAFTCHGSWQDNNTFYVITSPTSRKSADTLRYCFIYTVTHQDGAPSTSVAGVPQGSKPPPGGGPPILRLSAISESCHRHISPGIDGAWAFNFTSNGKFESCAEVETESAASALLPSFIILVTLSWITAVILR